MSTKAIQALLTESNDYPTKGGTVGFPLARDRLIEILSECSPGVSIGAIPTHYDPSGDGTSFQITVYATFARSELGMEPRKIDTYAEQKAALERWQTRHDTFVAPGVIKPATGGHSHTPDGRLWDNCRGCQLDYARETTLKKAMEVISSLRTLIETSERNGPASYEVTIQRARRILKRAPEEEKT